MYDIIGKRYIYFLISLIVIVPGIFALVVWGLPSVRKVSAACKERF